MKQLPIISILVFVYLAGFNNALAVEKKDLLIKSKGSYLNDLKEGIWEEYDNQQNLIALGSYQNGLRTGTWEVFYINGSLMQKGQLIKGFQEGYWEYFYDNGSIRAKGSWKEGKMTGFWEFFSLSAELEEVKRY